MGETKTKRVGRRAIGRVALGGALVFAGVAHLTGARKAFQAQVPEWVPVDADTTVVLSGVAEIALGTALIVLPKQKQAIGTIAALFFGAVFPGNVSQWVHGRDAFGLDTDGKRAIRLLFQPVLVGLAIWSTRDER